MIVPMHRAKLQTNKENAQDLCRSMTYRMLKTGRPNVPPQSPLRILTITREKETSSRATSGEVRALTEDTRTIQAEAIVLTTLSGISNREEMIAPTLPTLTTMVLSILPPGMHRRQSLTS